MVKPIDQSIIDFSGLDSMQSTYVIRWLQLGVLALGIAGLFAILLVLSRSPGMESYFPWIDFFRTALVIHVDQSVLIWFLSMAGVLWSLSLSRHNDGYVLQILGFLLAVLGALGLAASAFIGDGAALMNNYVPVLQRPFFFVALGLFAAGVMVLLVLVLLKSPWRELLSGNASILDVASVTVAVSCALSVMALVWSWVDIPASTEGHGFYEYLFWGAGHTLQFAYSQLLLFAWIVLAVFSGLSLSVNRKLLGLLLALGVLPALVVPVIYFAYPAVSAEARLAFTQLMQYGGGIAAAPIGLIVLYALFKGDKATSDQRPLRLSLWMSFLLFAAGGVIGILISGLNTIIPAHYHGSIVGVTLALMGLAYVLLPKLGYKVVSGRLANAQPLCYGVGQLLHISGLALSGALGIQRKTAGAAQGLDSLAAKLSMGIMGIGGLLAVIGGILFVWIMLRAFMQPVRNSAF